MFKRGDYDTAAIEPSRERPTQPLRPHHLDQRYLEERFKALEDRVTELERLADWRDHAGFEIKAG